MTYDKANKLWDAISFIHDEHERIIHRSGKKTYTIWELSKLWGVDEKDLRVTINNYNKLLRKYILRHGNHVERGGMYEYDPEEVLLILRVIAKIRSVPKIRSLLKSMNKNSSRTKEV